MALTPDRPSAEVARAEQRRMQSMSRQVALLTREVRRLQRSGGANSDARIAELEAMLAVISARSGSSGSSGTPGTGTPSDPGGGPVTPPGEVTPPPPSALRLATGVTGGVSWIDASWTPSSSTSVTAYEVLIQREGAAAMVQEVANASLRIEPVTGGQRYTISVCALTATRKKSTYVTGSILAGVDTTAPGPVTGILVGTGLRTITVSWTDNPEEDVRNAAGRYRVQLATTPYPATAA